MFIVTWQSDLGHLRSDINLYEQRGIVECGADMKTPGLNRPDRPDGKSYVDAVTAAGQRSRTLIYFIVILTVLTFATERNDYSPDWVSLRYGLREALYTCYVREQCYDLDKRLIESGLVGRSGPFQYGRQRASKALGIDFESLRPKPNTNPAPAAIGNSAAPGTELDNWPRRELVLTTEALIKRDMDNNTITLPVLGSSIDINDLWMASGGMMFFLLYFLRTSQKQEERNIKYIQARKKEFDDLVVMTQVLSPHSLEVGTLGKMVEWGFGLMPSFLYLYLAVQDWRSFDLSILYLGQTETFVEYAIELLLVGFVVYNNVQCLMNQQNIRKLIKPAYSRLSGS